MELDDDAWPKGGGEAHCIIERGHILGACEERKQKGILGVTTCKGRWVCPRSDAFAVQISPSLGSCGQEAECQGLLYKHLCNEVISLGILLS